MMKLKNIKINLLWILFFLPLKFLEAQEKDPITQEEQKKEEQEIAKKKEEEKINYRYGIFLGGDLYSPIRGQFDKARKTLEFEGYVRIYKKFHLAAEIGHSTLIFDKLDWKANLKGKYYKLGINYSVGQFSENPDEMFYIGFRYAYSPYFQHIEKYPIRFFDESQSQKKHVEGKELPKISLKAHWIEPVLGARLAVFKTGFYIDASLNVKFLIAATKQQEIKPLTIPGFGENIDNKNMSIKWALIYKIPIGRKSKQSFLN